MIRSMIRSTINNEQWYKSMRAGNPLTGDYELIATGAGDGSSAFIQFASIPADYSHLQLRGTFRGTDSAVRVLNIILNGIGGTSYSSHSLIGTGSAVSSAAVTSSSRAEVSAVIPGTGQSTGIFNAFVIDILDYKSTSKNTTIRSLVGYAGSTSRITLNSGLLNNTAAINTVKVEVSVGSLAAESRLSLYGIKG